MESSPKRSIEIDHEASTKLEVLTKRKMVDGSIDYKGRPADKARTGGWNAVLLLFMAQFAEKAAQQGLVGNLVTYLVSQKRLAVSFSATVVTNLGGTMYLTPLFGGLLSDAWLGRFWTIMFSSATEIIGYVLLTLSAALLMFNGSRLCNPNHTCKSGHKDSMTLFYFGIYLVAVGVGGIRACIPAFGADQFEEEDPVESKHLSSYFNCYYFALNLGSLIGVTLLTYVQDGRGWALGFGTLFVTMVFCLIFVCIGSPLYRYKAAKGSPLLPVVQVFVAAYRNRQYSLPNDSQVLSSVALAENPVRMDDNLTRSRQFRFLDKATINSQMGVEDLSKFRVESSSLAKARDDWRYASVSRVEGVKMILRLLPIAAATCIFSTVEAQFTTLTIEQAMKMNRNITSRRFQLPAASVNIFQVLGVLIFLPVYDKLIVPSFRNVTGNPKGITTLQRIGIGLLLSSISMVSAAIVEAKRLAAIQEHKVQFPSFAVWWLVPQYTIMGLAEVFTYAGQLDFFYSEAPADMQAVATSLGLCTRSVGYFTSSVVVSTVNKLTGMRSRSLGGATESGWLANDLDLGHLDYYYWLLAVLSLLNLGLYLLCASKHQYKTQFVRASVTTNCPPDNSASDHKQANLST